MGKVIAFVFARGGSKGLPGKNIKLLKGIPLLAYSIRIAKNLNLIDSVYVSTDCSDIEKVAVENGAKLIATCMAKNHFKEGEVY